MKVAFLIPRLSGGGAEFVASQWASYLGAAGHSATLLTTHATPAQQARDGVPPDTSVVALQAQSFPARVAELRRHLAAAHYDVLVAMMPHWNVLALLATLPQRPEGPAVVISGRNMESALRGTLGLNFTLELRLAALLYRRADGYIAVSHPVGAEAASRYRLEPDRIWVVPNPSVAKVQTVAASPRRRRPSRDVPSSVTLTVPARLVAQKRPVLALETAALLRQSGIDARVHYFGEGPLEDQVRSAAAGLDVPVRLRGWVPNWFDEAADDAVALLPSIAEGCANVMLEAAAAGIPSVATSQAFGVADAMVPHVTGMLCMGSTPADFAEAVVRAMALAPVSAGDWLERFSAQESGRQLLQVLQRTLSRRGAAGHPTANPGGRTATPLATPGYTSGARPVKYLPDSDSSHLDIR